MRFVHLHTHTPFSFLDGASSIELLVNRAVEMEMPALAVTDHNNLCAAVKFARAARSAGLKAIQGVELTLANQAHVTVLARNRSGYTSLCRLLSRAYLRSPGQEAQLHLEELAELTDCIVLSGCRRGEIASLILNGQILAAREKARQYLTCLGRGNFYLEMQDNLLPGNHLLNHALLQIAEDLKIPPVATNNVHYLRHEDFIVHDLLTCVRTLSRVEDIHPLRPFNGENYFKSPRQMSDLFSFCPRALENTLHIAEQCEELFSSPRPLHFPAYALPAGKDAATLLHQLAFDGARQRYGRLPRAVTERLEYELGIITSMGFASYFLLVWDLVRLARREGIRYAGRGSAADSLVAYCLYISEVDSLERGLFFERFMSPERSQLPDIDIDFEHGRREQVIDYVYKKYGAERVARVATYNTFKARSALRDIGKALGFGEEELGPIARTLPHTYADNIRPLMQTLPELRNSPLWEERFHLLLDICAKIAGFPRFLGMHSSGLVISDCPLDTLTPLQYSPSGLVMTQFDKDDIEDLGLVKLDLLSLRTMSVINDTCRDIESSGDRLDYEQIPLDDPETYALISSGETLGVFQLESPAQRALQSQLGASGIEDVVASMALIRPGPIKGNMVDPYIARRQGKEPVTYLHPLLEPILEKTYGVILFQEQVMEIAVRVAGFTPGEADQLRRVMTHARSQAGMNEIGEHFVTRALQNGIDEDIAREIFACMAGYASYGFCEAHAAAFATTSYKTAYLLKHYPAEYYAALLNHQPLGYYPPHIVVTAARQRGIKLFPPDINYSTPDFRVEAPLTIRTGLKQVKGIRSGELESIMHARSRQYFSSLPDLLQQTRLQQDTLENLVKCGALDSLHPNRRQLLSLLPVLLEENRSQNQPRLFDGSSGQKISDFTAVEKYSLQYAILGIDTGPHVMALLRPQLQKRGILSSREIKSLPHNHPVRTSGLLFRPHRPPTRSGRITVFFSLEDEFGLIDGVVFEEVYLRQGGILFQEQKAPLLVSGRLQRKGRGVSLIAQRLSFLA